MSASSKGAGRAGGYARYLEGKTVAPERGDYYLTADGQLREAPGRWLSDPETLESLGIAGAGPVDGPAFSAPKGVSVVWALADSWQREQVEAAHERAVERAMGYLRANVGVVRRRYEARWWWSRRRTGRRPAAQTRIDNRSPPALAACS